MIQFKCPHRPWRERLDMTRQEKADARAVRYDVPDDAVWEKVDHQYSPDKTMQRKVLGKVVHVKPYEHEIGHNWQTVLTCPACDDQILFVTDQDPEAVDA